MTEREAREWLYQMVTRRRQNDPTGDKGILYYLNSISLKKWTAFLVRCNLKPPPPSDDGFNWLTGRIDDTQA